MGIAYFEFFMDCTSSDKVRNWHLHWTECAHFSTLMLFTLPCLCTWKLELVFSLQGEIDQQLNSLGIQRHDWESTHRAYCFILFSELWLTVRKRIYLEINQGLFINLWGVIYSFLHTAMVPKESQPYWVSVQGISAVITRGKNPKKQFLKSWLLV